MIPVSMDTNIICLWKMYTVDVTHLWYARKKLLWDLRNMKDSDGNSGIRERSVICSGRGARRNQGGREKEQESAVSVIEKHKSQVTISCLKYVQYSHKVSGMQFLEWKLARHSYSISLLR